MRRALQVLGALWLGAVAAPRGALAQAAAAALAGGVRAYDDLEFDNAAGLLRRALAVQGPDALAPAEASRALMYLAATEVFREHGDSARAIARRLVLANPRFRPDELVFPPQVLALYDEIRRATPAVMARPPVDWAFQAGNEVVTVRLFASTFHEVAATLVAQDGRVVRALYAGPIGDSVDVHWNGLDSTSRPPPSGRYAIAVTSLDRTRRVVRILRLPFQLTHGPSDTLPHPAPPADSLLRPERRPMGPALRVLAPGVLAGAAIALLPSVIADGEGVSEARFVVGGAVTIAGIAAFLSHHPGRSMPANVAHNRTLRDAWRRQLDDVKRRNAERSGGLAVRFDAPVLLTPEGP